VRTAAAIATLALGAAALALAARPWGPPPAAPAPTMEEAAPAPAPGFAAPADGAPPTLTAFLERPPFSAARRPPPPALAAAPAPSPPATDPDLLFGQWEVVGVVATGADSVALLRDAAAGDLRRLKIGDRLGVAELIGIEMGALTFRAGDATVRAKIENGGQAR
jgi:general secretion pathway protein N